MNKLSYSKSKKNNMYFIDIDGIKITEKICEYLHITIEEYVETIMACGGKYSHKYGFFLPNEDSAIACVVALTLIQK